MLAIARESAQDNNAFTVVPGQDNALLEPEPPSARGACGLYETTPLGSSNHIRLLIIDPSSNTQAINCSVSVADLSTWPYYCALSYTWGPPTYQAEQRGMSDKRCCSITCNGETVLVAENLFHFLQQASAKSHFGPWWIDAICINQEDVSERSREILKMTDIYSTADSVVVWLGKEDEYTKPALQLLTALGELDLDTLRRLDPMSPSNETKARIGAVLKRAIDESDWTALALLYKRTWFSRVWILQECRLARATTYRCGDYIVNKNHLVRVGIYIKNSRWASQRGFFNKIHSAGIFQDNAADYVVMVLYLIYHREFLFGSRLSTAIINGGMCTSTDPRDKVYALLSFFDGSPEERRSYSLMSPDYTKTVPQVYAEATEYILRNSPSLLALSLVGDKVYKRVPDLPSWVPDYSLTWVSNAGFQKNKLYSASRDSAPQWRILNRGKILALTASRIDTISHLGESKYEITRGARGEQLLHIITGMKDRYVNGQNKLEALWRTLIEDSDYEMGSRYNKDGCPAPTSLAVAFKAFLLYHAALWVLKARKIETPGDRSHPSDAILAVLEDMSRDDATKLVPRTEEIHQLLTRPERKGTSMNDIFYKRTEAYRSYWDAFCRVPEGRFFRTQGGLMGMGPQSLQVDDSIWLVPGAKVLFVLREKRGTPRFELMGDCYVHGRMHGEALEDAMPNMTTVELE
ncbi:MAG: hypothetical protein L6R35_002457 [Caloplaca aegaea]|nr:MAG: hypothetical protein L6R35_002457 [Caloplaca aegaea]